MGRRNGWRLGALTLGLQMAMAGTALAHHPIIEARAECVNGVNGVAIIKYTVTSWSFTPGQGENPEIGVYFNGQLVDTGALVAPTYSFTGSKPAPETGNPVTVTAEALKPWGNTFVGGSSSTSVTIPSNCPRQLQIGRGRFTGGGFQFDVGGVRVTRGLTIHCDLLLSNNLEVNWGGNRFHMTRHLSAICTDSPSINQQPPKAPLDTMIGVGEGRYNNASGYTVAFTLVDAGEPGRNDQAALLIYQTSNPSNVVLNVPLQVLSGGNLQAHYDQPHNKKK